MHGVIHGVMHLYYTPCITPLTPCQLQESSMELLGCDRRSACSTDVNQPCTTTHGSGAGSRRSRAPRARRWWCPGGTVVQEGGRGRVGGRTWWDRGMNGLSSSYGIETWKWSSPSVRRGKHGLPFGSMLSTSMLVPGRVTCLTHVGME